MEIEFGIEDLAGVVGTYLKPLVLPGTIFTFRGPLGAGKTTLIKILLAQCGVKELITSPTFTYVNSYHGEGSQMFHHFDLYRIDNFDAFVTFGFDEYLQEDAIIFIEWPEIIAGLLRQESFRSRVCEVRLSYKDHEKAVRLLNIVPPRGVGDKILLE